VYDIAAFARLKESAEYENWLLEDVYRLGEAEFFPDWPDAVIYPIDRKNPRFILHASANIVIGDWRAGFLKAGAPLAFVTAFKLLDMLLEWVLKENGASASFRFKEKLRQLEDTSLAYPQPFSSRPWLRERIVGLYRTLEPLRGTIIHTRHFAADNGELRVSDAKKGVVGTPVVVSADSLRTLARTAVSSANYAAGTWAFDEFRERSIRYDLDQLSPFHGCGYLGQLQPLHSRVRVYTASQDPLAELPADPVSDINQRFVGRDNSFDLRVIQVRDGVVVGAYLFPWRVLATGPDWKRKIDSSAYQVAIPTDIHPGDLVVRAQEN
jgi:hypothetical protein